MATPPDPRPGPLLTRVSVLVMIVLAMVVLAVSGCARSTSSDRAQAGGPAGDPVGDPASDPTGDPVEESPGSAVDDGAGTTADPEPGDQEELSVLGRHLGYEIPGLDPGDEVALRRVEQETIEACMRAQGFAYIAWVPDPATIYAPVEEGLDSESREFAARYGFGVSTQFYAQTDVGPGLIGHSGDGSGTGFEENPNERIRQALSAEELEAYDRVFWGADNPLFKPISEVDDDDVLFGRQIASHGCIGEAQRAIDGEASAVLDLFAIEILGMPERARSDPRYVDYAQEVERCTNAAGYDFYVNRPDWVVLAHFDEMMFEIDELVGGNPFDRLTEAELATMSQAELDALYDAPRDLPPQALDRLAQVQALETATATAVWDCGGNRAEQRRVVAEILDDLQADFIAEHGDELAEFRQP